MTIRASRRIGRCQRCTHRWEEKIGSEEVVTVGAALRIELRLRAEVRQRYSPCRDRTSPTVETFTQRHHLSRLATAQTIKLT